QRNEKGSKTSFGSKFGQKKIPLINSSKAAELLVKDKGTVPGFVGFGPSQNELGYVPAVQGFEEVDNSVDPDFRMVLRKMSKRDATTKLKAVQEFGAMCKERDPETIKAVLPYWSRIYCKISLDHDRRIREAAQQAFELLVFQVKRNLAPYLKNIMGYWLISQCDTYTPAASAAKQAFQAAFPPPKQPEAMAFCKEEITNILYDNIMKETPDTLSDPQSVPEEEREGKYQRVVTSSLLALKKLLDLLPENECMILKDRLMELLSQPKFWKYSKHKTPQVIRSAFFELIVAFCQHLPELMKAEAAKVCSAVLLNIDDSDPVVCPSIWEAILYVLTCIEDCWSHVNAKKGVLPKLWTLLKEGGRGLATVVYPSLLPFISKLPEEVIGSKMDFFTIFFSTFNKGLVSDRAAVSCSESSAIVTAFMECLRFTLHQNLGEDEDQHKLQQMLINDQLLPLLQFTLKTPKLQNGTFCHLVDILTSWEKRVDNPEIEECAGAYRKLLSIFWDGLSQLCLSQVARMDTDKNLLDGVSSLLQFLENPVRSRKQSVKKKRSIRFLDEAETKDGENNIANRIAKNVHGCEQLSVTSRLVQQNSPSRTEPLESLVHELAKLAMTFIKEQNSEKHLEFLIGLTSLFPSRKLFIVLLENVDPVSPGLFLETNDEVKAMANNPAVQFLYQKLIFWFKESRADLNCLVDMLYSVLHCCNNNQERKAYLLFLQMECGWLILLQIIQKACADPAKYAAVSDWLKGEILGEKLVVLTEELCTMGITHSTQPNDGGAHSWILLSLALSKRINNEFLIAEVYIERIIERLHNALSKANDLSKTGTQEPSISFVCDLASNFFCSIKGCLQMSSAGDLLLTIFQLCAQSQEKTLLSDVELHKLQQTWLLGLTSLISQQGGCFRRDGFFHNSALWVKKQVQTSELDIKSLQCMLGLQWLNKVLLKGQISLNRDALCTRIDSHSSEKIPNHLCAAALLTQVALRIQENNVFEEKYLPLMMYSLQWCEEMKDFCPVSEYCGLLLQLNITHDRLRKACSTLDETLFNRFFPLTEANLHTIQSIAPFILQEDKELLVVQSALSYLCCVTGGFGCLAVLNSCLQKGANMDEQLFVDVLSTMMNWRNNEEEIFFFDGTLENPKPNLLGINVEILRFLRLLIKYLPSSVTAEQWDFVMCSMLTWLQTVCETVTLESSPLMLLFACQSCGMLSDLSNMFQTLTPEISKNVPSFLPSEWSDFFCKGTLLFPTSTYLLTAFGEAAAVTPLKQLINHSLPAKLIAGQSTNLPDKLQTLLNTFAPLLLFLARPVQITVYHLLHKLMPELPVFDNEQLKSCEDNGNDEEHALSPPAALMTVIGAQEEDLENIFSNVPVGEYTVIEPLSEAYYCVLGYLLAWKLILVFFKASQSELRVQYATYLRKSKSLHKLLQHLFRLMPENPTIPGQVSDSSSKGTKTLFTEHHTILLQETENLHTELPQLACSVYYSVLEDLPATVRLWWNSQDKRISSTVDRYTSRYVSHVLSSQEIAAVQTSTQTFTSMMVKARPAAREVLATYSVDDIFIELVIQLPTNYPLGSITVESGKRVGVAVQQWRNWMLQLNTFLNLQNGSIMEGLTLWKSNVDKRFEGIEECMICFSVIHGSNCSLPKKACRTCKKKFHSACLYRWFTSSNKSTCPLCRETFF
uniref:E3 ubiquitin-protein ligase listerin n=1 Tax=Callorhinchus milii TaxID=7868 RepID=A0A4W3I203_CALMI